MINESLRYSGSAFAMKRFAKYRGTVDWKGHSIYMSVQIDDSVLLVADNLDGIRAEVKAVVKG